MSNKSRKDEIRRERILARASVGVVAVALLIVFIVIGKNLFKKMDENIETLEAISGESILQGEKIAQVENTSQGDNASQKENSAESSANSYVENSETAAEKPDNQWNTEEEVAKAPTVEVATEPTEDTTVETVEPTPEPTPIPEVLPSPSATQEVLTWNDQWEYAGFSMIHDSSVTLYRSESPNRKNIVIGINAGHGTSGGNKVRTQCHPDGSAKVTGGSTAQGETTAAAVSAGTTFLDGTSEATATLDLANLCKEYLLEEGYDVLMIRESSDCRLDNIARTVFCNQYADCHLALHYDSTETDKGFFYIGVPDVASYKAMEPVASHWQQHEALGNALLSGMTEQGIKIRGQGTMALDLTQTSYSTIPSVDVEVGDRGSDHSEKTQRELAKGIVKGVNKYFNQ